MEAPDRLSFRTASGERIPDQGVKTFWCRDERGKRRRLTGRVAEVHKALVSAAAVCDKGQDLYLGAEGGYVLGPKITKLLRAAFEDIVAVHGYDDTTPVHREKNVFNFYVRDVVGRRCGASTDACPLDEAPGAAGRQPGGRRQAVAP